MEAGGKMKGSRGYQTNKPYARSSGLLGRVSESVKDMFSPSWLVDLVSSVKKKTPPPDSQQTEQATEQCGGYGNYAAGRPMPDLSNSYNPPHITPSLPSYSPHIQHSTPATHGQEPHQFTASAMSFAGLTKLDLQSNMLMNGNDEHAELSEFAPPSSTSYNPNRQHHQVGMGQSKYLNEGHSKIQQLRQELGGSVTPSKEIEERGRLQSQTSESKAPQVPEPSFLWANETKREVKKNDPQPPAKRHKPNFSASVFGAPSFSMNQSADASIQYSSNSFHNSTFYAGKTTFGGASSSRNRGRQASGYQITPTRKQVSARTPSASRAGVTSSAAKRILDCLERMSTPLSDAKKIPSYNSSMADSPLSFTPGVYRRRSLRQSAIKDAPPVGSLSTPTQASIGRNLQKPGQVSGLHRMAVRQAGHSSQSNEEPSPVAFNTGPKESAKAGGKMKKERSTFHSSKRQEEDEEEVVAPNLPTTFTLPVSDNLPKFDFAATSKAATSRSQRPEFITSSPIVSESSDKKQQPFTFSSPIAEATKSITVPAGSLKQAFTFSSPISVDKQAPVPEVSGIVSSAPALAFTFQPSTNLKVKQKVTNEESQQKVVSGGLKPASELKKGGVMDILGKAAGPSPAQELKTGSVMDALSKRDTSSNAKAPPLSSLFKPSSSTWSCPECMVQNQDSMDKCPCCETAKPVAKKTPAVSDSKLESKVDSSKPSLSSLFKATSGWSCPTCMVRNEDSKEKCPCCETAKPATKTTSIGVSSAKVDSTSDKPSLASLFKPKAGWSCPECMVQNEDSMTKCPCCETPKPGSKPVPTNQAASSQVSSKPSLSSMFKKPEGNWDCDTCMVSNKKDATKCIACETPKPGLKTSSSFTSEGGFSTIKFGMPTSTTEKKSTENVTESSSETKQPSFSFGFKSTSDKVESSTDIKFGVVKDSHKDTSKETKTNETKPDLGGFKFGAPTSSTDKPAIGITFGVPKSDSSEKKDTQPSSSDSKPVFGGFNMNPSSANSETTKPVAGGFAFGSKPSSSDQSNKSVQPVEGFSFGTSKPESSNTSGKAAEVGGFQFGAKVDSDKDKNVSSSAPGFNFGASSTPNTKPDAVVSSSGIFGSTTVSNSKPQPEVSKPVDKVSSSIPVFGSATGSSSGTSSAPATTTSSAASAGFNFSAGTTSGNTSSAGFNFTATPLASGVFGSTSTSSGFGGFGAAASSSQPATKSGTTGGFNFSANASVTSAVTTTTSSSSASGFVGFSAVAQPSKPAESKPASSLFAFGQAPKSDNTDAAKPLGVPSAGGFTFGAAATSAPAPATQSSNMFSFSGAKASETSSPLKRGRDTSNGENQDAKKATGLFGSTGSGVFGQQASSSVFGSSNSTFGSSAATTNAGTSVFGSSSTPAQSGSGGSTVFGGAQSAAAPGFSFSTSTNQQPASGSSNLFVFGSNQNQSNNSAPFGQTGQQNTSTASVFGNQPAQPSANQPAPGGFNFSATPSFNFGAAPAAPSGGNQAFQFSAQPSTTNMFNATASTTSATTRRPIKKAIRRTARK